MSTTASATLAPVARAALDQVPAAAVVALPRPSEPIASEIDEAAS